MWWSLLSDYGNVQIVVKICITHLNLPFNGHLEIRIIKRCRMVLKTLKYYVKEYYIVTNKIRGINYGFQKRMGGKDSTAFVKELKIFLFVTLILSNKKTV